MTVLKNRYNREMTSKERFLAVMNRQKPDCVPIDLMPEVVLIMRMAGGKVIDYFRDKDKIVKGLIAIRDRYKVDAFSVAALTYTELFGGKVAYLEDRYPPITEPIFNSVEDIDRAKIPDPEEIPSIKVAIDAVKILCETVGKEMTIGGLCIGTFNLARELVGAEKLLVAFHRNPEFVHKAANIACEALIKVGKAFIKAGVDYIWYPDASSSPAWISPAHYEEFAIPYHSKFFQAMKKEGVFTIYHPCGGEYPIFLQLPKVQGVDAYHFSELVDIDIARKIFGPDTILWGNVNPSETLLLKTPLDVEEEVKGIIEKAGKMGRLIMSIGCSLAPDTPPENIEALVESTRKYGKYPLK